ncbi:hypothetical protein A2372_04015 [Candidatus Wolfebacteria bacterium RIFOXYB1_FULL_54_12]|uniref:Uncharacterized protein n=1 Tax=Candidatus Wolfebacteria bacterium RIFOXYB1_FULL_54_12 TaxID=1802559 RepID=A0A1F8DVQ7_9BACT|nr:MAG: hypothetical protein A2372_04015 [Candidatus Wolfebacteria bacterium RIFOXYB1_FULL_54_12]
MFSPIGVGTVEEVDHGGGEGRRYKVYSMRYEAWGLKLLVIPYILYSYSIDKLAICKRAIYFPLSMLYT